MRTCAQCGAKLTEVGPAGLCPRCFSQAGLAPAEADAPPAPDATEPSAAAARQIKLQHFGDYELLERIASGGMGIVYKARQVSLNRIVALKMIMAGELASAEAVKRFHTEAEAVAGLDHPNIVSIYEVGEHEGQHYFSMQFVEGRNLSQHVAGGRRRLPSLEAARLLASVARAMHHAHQRGILHRDLKPANILVDAHGQPHVTDFGLAKQIEGHAELTLSGKTMGTPKYNMSPEQAAGPGSKLTTAADIYSLGAVLYFLLAGRAPFEGATPLEVLRKVIETEPLPPSEMLRSQGRASPAASPPSLRPPPSAVDKDLETICLLCLEKDPARRYASADALADDLERWLRHEPIRARPSSWREHLAKWVKRNPALSAMGAIALVTLVLGLDFSLWTSSKERVARQRVVAAEQQAQAEAGKSQQVALFLKDMLRGVGPSVASGRDTTLLQEILDKTVERVGRDLKYQPEVEMELRNTIGQVYRELGNYEKAEEMHRAALALARKRPAARRLGEANALAGLGWALWSQGRLEEAEAAAQDALHLRQALRGAEHPDVAASWHQLAGIRYLQNRLPETEACERAALAMLKRSGDDEHPEVAAECLGGLASALHSQGKFAEAEPFCRVALTTAKQTLRAEHPSVAGSLVALAMVLADQGKRDEAESLFREGLAMTRRLYGDEHQEVASVLVLIAQNLWRQGKLPEAESVMRAALVPARSPGGDETGAAASALVQRATVLRQEGKFDEAESTFLEALALSGRLRTRSSSGDSWASPAWHSRSTIWPWCSSTRDAQAEPLK